MRQELAYMLCHHIAHAPRLVLCHGTDDRQEDGAVVSLGEKLSHSRAVLDAHEPHGVLLVGGESREEREEVLLERGLFARLEHRGGQLGKAGRGGPPHHRGVVAAQLREECSDLRTGGVRQRLVCHRHQRAGRDARGKPVAL